MGLQRTADLECINQRFGYLRNLIEQAAMLNHQNLNLISENFFRDLLNLILSANFENLNATDPNAAAIDLGDTVRRECIQVTATSDRTKIQTTLDKFVKNNLNKKYHRLIVLISTAKKKYQGSKLKDKTGKFEIDLKQDVWDFNDLLRKIENLPQEHLARVRAFVEAGITLPASREPLREVQTFMDLMALLSDETHEDVGKGMLVKPDPDQKINRRFRDHADYLMDEYALYYGEFGAVWEEVSARDGLGGPRMRRLSLHLRTKSNNILTETGGDPAKALDKLVEFYVETLQDNGKVPTEGAVRFFLLHQMLECHVFPEAARKSA